MGILIVFMSNTTPQIFYQWVFAVFTCVFYSYTHVIWSPDLWNYSESSELNICICLNYLDRFILRYICICQSHVFLCVFHYIASIFYLSYFVNDIFRGGLVKWVLSPQMATFRCFEWSFLNITLQIFCFCRHMWRCGDHLPTSDDIQTYLCKTLSLNLIIDDRLLHDYYR